VKNESKRLAGATALTLALAACAPATPLTQVMDADRAFARHARDYGIRAAFVEFAAPEAVMFRDGVGPIKGRDAIGDAFAHAQGASLEWEPEAGEIAASGDLAYTWGYAKFTSADGTKTWTSNYVTIWRRIDGRWKWVVDLGVLAPPK
jgi:ketosteroid isomerase-like protein